MVPSPDARADLDAAIAETERWFVDRGIPHLIHRYSAARDVFTRASPLLGLVFVAEVLGALNLDWPLWVNVLAGLGGVAMLVGGLAASNAIRDRPLLARPETVGTPDLAVFVLVPPLLPLVFGGQVRDAALTAVANLGFVGLVYIVTSYGLIPMTRWGLGRMARQFGDLFGLLVRALPLLLLFVTFLFINAEVWQVSAALDGPFFWAALGLFIVFGLVAIDVSVIETWTGAAANDLARLDLFDETVPLTEELLRVAGFLAAFSGLYFTVYALTDSTYREEFYEDVVAEVHEVLAVRAVYLPAVAAAA